MKLTLWIYILQSLRGNFSRFHHFIAVLKAPKLSFSNYQVKYSKFYEPGIKHFRVSDTPNSEQVRKIADYVWDYSDVLSFVQIVQL